MILSPFHGLTSTPAVLLFVFSLSYHLMCGDISYPVEYKLCLHVIAVEQTDMSTQITNSYYNHLIKKKNLPKSKLLPWRLEA